MTESTEKYSGKVRVRVCGFLIENDRVLLIKHKNLGPKGYIWSPPGGGVEFHEEAEKTLQREFREETGLIVKIESFLFVNEYMNDHLHAIELFFSVSKTGGKLKLGSDPELAPHDQILEDIRWFSTEDLRAMDHNNLHNAFMHTNDPQVLGKLSGFFKFVNISVK